MALAVTLAPACSPPTDSLTRVGSATAPLLAEPAADQPPLAVLHAGELLQVVGKGTRLDWSGAVGDETDPRSGTLVRVKRSPGDSGAWMFESDLGDVVKVLRADRVCRRLGAGPDCPRALRRVALSDGGLLAYRPCAANPCRAALLRGDTVSTIDLDGILAMHAARIGGREVALADVVWSRDSKWTGGGVVVLSLGDGPRGLRRLLFVDTNFVDGRNAPAIERRAKVVITDEGVRLEGTERMLSPEGTRQLFSRRIDELHRLPR